MSENSPNKLFYGDNLDVLGRHVADESVDLVYLDPPFNSNANYNVLFAERDGTQAAAQIGDAGDALVVLVGAAPGAAPGVEPRRGAGVHVRGLMGRLWLRLWLPLMIILALLTGWGLGAFMAWLFPSIFGPVPF